MKQRCLIETTAVELTGTPSSPAAVQIARHAAYAGRASAKGAHSAKHASCQINPLDLLEVCRVQIDIFAKKSHTAAPYYSISMIYYR
jgi:hypothetical protein